MKKVKNSLCCSKDKLLIGRTRVDLYDNYFCSTANISHKIKSFGGVAS